MELRQQAWRHEVPQEGTHRPAAALAGCAHGAAQGGLDQALGAGLQAQPLDLPPQALAEVEDRELHPAAGKAWASAGGWGRPGPTGRSRVSAQAGLKAPYTRDRLPADSSRGTARCTALAMPPRGAGPATRKT